MSIFNLVRTRAGSVEAFAVAHTLRSRTVTSIDLPGYPRRGRWDRRTLFREIIKSFTSRHVQSNHGCIVQSVGHYWDLLVPDRKNPRELSLTTDRVSGHSRSRHSMIHFLWVLDQTNISVDPRC